MFLFFKIKLGNIAFVKTIIYRRRGVMAPQKINTFIIRFENEIKFSDIPYFRSGILSAMDYDANVLFHNHKSDTEFRYSYPLIQYKRINKKAAIVCLGEGALTIGEFFLRQNLNIRVKDEVVELKVESFRPGNYIMQPWGTMFLYRLRKWLPLNSENYIKYTQLEGVVEKTAFLEKILVGNILSMAKGLDIGIDAEIQCKIISIDSPRLMLAKGVKLMSFDIEFKTNISIPDYAGLGKHSSLGFGIVTKKKNKDEQ